jgi:hypothetical protein
MTENDPQLSGVLLWNNEEAATLSLSLLYCYSFLFPSCFKPKRTAEQFALGSQLIPRLKHRLSAPFGSGSAAKTSMRRWYGNYSI